MKGLRALLGDVLEDSQQIFCIVLCASMVTGASSDPAKIETQGPQPQSCKVFWRTDTTPLSMLPP